MKFFRAIFGLFFAVCLGLVFYYVSILVRQPQLKKMHDPEFSTVSGWAQNCFQTYQEFDAALAPEEPYPATILPWQLLRYTVDSYIDTFAQSDFYKESSWVDGKIPPQDFLELISDNKIFDMLATFFANKKDEAAAMDGELLAIDFKHSFVQKLRLRHPSKICFIGDIHSSIHSLLRTLLRLITIGFLNDDFTLTDKNHYIIFDGDFADFGRYGAEVLYTVMKLKNANRGHVLMMRGNHDKFATKIIDNLIYELKAKYPTQKDFNAITRIYRFLPFALYLGPALDEHNKEVFVQCCHGGIEIAFDPAKLLEASDKNTMFQKIDALGESGKSGDSGELMRQKLIAIKALDVGVKQDNNLDGLVWSDFKQKLHGKIELNHERPFGYVADLAATRLFLQANPKIKAFFRAHQDKHYGLKLFFPEDASVSEEVKKNNPKYPDGPYHWLDVVTLDDQQNPEGFLVSNYGPVFTFSTAAEGRGLFYDCYGILSTAKNYADWRLKPHEFELSRTRKGQYVWAEFDKKAKNVYERLLVKWSPAPNNKPLIAL